MHKRGYKTTTSNSWLRANPDKNSFIANYSPEKIAYFGEEPKRAIRDRAPTIRTLIELPQFGRKLMTSFVHLIAGYVIELLREGGKDNAEKTTAFVNNLLPRVLNLTPAELLLYANQYISGLYSKTYVFTVRAFAQALDSFTTYLNNLRFEVEQEDRAVAKENAQRLQKEHACSPEMGINAPEDTRFGLVIRCISEFTAQQLYAEIQNHIVDIRMCRHVSDDSQIDDHLIKHGMYPDDCKTDGDLYYLALNKAGNQRVFELMEKGYLEIIDQKILPQTSIKQAQ